MADKKKTKKRAYAYTGPKPPMNMTYDEMMAWNTRRDAEMKADSIKADQVAYPYRYTPEGQQAPEEGETEGLPYEERKFKTEKEAKSSQAQHNAMKRYESGEATDEDLKLLKISDYNQKIYRIANQSKRPGYAQQQQSVSDSSAVFQDYTPHKTRKREQAELDETNYQKSEEKRKKEHDTKVDDRDKLIAKEKLKMKHLEDEIKWRDENMVYDDGTGYERDEGWYTKSGPITTVQTAKNKIRMKRLLKLQEEMSDNPNVVPDKYDPYQPGAKPPPTPLKKRDYQKKTLKKPAKPFSFSKNIPKE